MTVRSSFTEKHAQKWIVLRKDSVSEISYEHFVEGFVGKEDSYGGL